MNEREALKFVLEAITRYLAESPEPSEEAVEELCDVASVARKVLAQPEQQPVAWRAWVPKFPPNTGNDWVYVNQPMVNPLIHNQPLYTSPPQRQPLTDEEILAIARDHYNPYQRAEISFARAIEAAHQIGEQK